jgi:hypothetical protein
MPAARLASNKDLIVVSADGTLDLAASEAAIEELLADLERDPQKAVIFDLRGAGCALSVGEVYGLADFLSKHSSKPALYRKIAVLIPSKAHQEKAEFFALCAENRGLESRAFSAIEDLGEWLGTDVSGLFGQGQTTVLRHREA